MGQILLSLEGRMPGFILLILAWGVAFGGSGMKLESIAFREGEDIPRKYTCDGADISPPLSWSGVPAGAKNLVLIMDDPDAPVGTFTHWVVYDIPAEARGLEEGMSKVPQIEGIKQGKNNFGRVGYGGPCPPRGHGAHRYFFKLYALDIESLGLPPGSTRRQVEERMKGHIVGETSLMGRYRRD